MKFHGLTFVYFRRVVSYRRFVARSDNALLTLRQLRQLAPTASAGHMVRGQQEARRNGPIEDLSVNDWGLTMRRLRCAVVVVVVFVRRHLVVVLRSSIR